VNPKPDKIGLSRREMEWTLQGILRNAPADPQALVRLLSEAIMAIVEQNNAALARVVRPQSHDEREA
jgi:hypothetical protein